MRGFLLFVIALPVFLELPAQQFSAKEFLLASSLTEKKFDNYLSKRFSPCGNKYKNDTIINIYNIRPDKKKKHTDSIKRRFETYEAKDYFSFAFFTSSRKEFEETKKTLYEEGFFCGSDSAAASSALFQKKNISVLINKKEQDDTLYSFLYRQSNLPAPDKIKFADDLLQFNSHEFLVSVFGEKNVIKDVYYLSEKEFVKCSVLFPRTSRQAVFFWQDVLNMTQPTTIIIGGNMNTGSSANYDGLIGENVWSSKDGIYSGMSLNSLIKLNGNTFKFYGKNSTSPYLILPENNGLLDFKINAVVLGCLNPSGSDELEKTTVEADKILHDNLGLYVFMMIFYPQAGEEKRQADLSRK